MPGDEAAAAGFMRRAVALSLDNVRRRAGGPFGAVIVLDGVVVGEDANRVTATKDPTAHAEIVAIRDACARLGRFSLDGAELYTSCEPCPMCLAAAYWARVGRLVFANDRDDAAAAGFDDAALYHEVALPPAARSLPMGQMPLEEARAVLKAWAADPERVPY